MGNKSNQDTESKINVLQQQYLTTLQNHADELEKLFSICQKNKLESKDRERLLFNSHRLAGNGAMFGFPDISKFGMELQDALNDKPDAQGESLVEKISVLTDACNKALSGDISISHKIENKVHNKIKSTKSKSPSKASSELPLVLVADDDENIQNVIKDLLKKDARIITSKNSAEILDLVIKNKPDLILLDDIMPGGISGLEILEKIQSMEDIKNIPVVMLTASDKADKVMQGLMAGAVDYIIKPFDPQKLAEKIQGRLKKLSSQILIADDDDVICQLLEHKFINAGYRVISVSDGTQAWDAIQKQNFVLVILDYMMPGFDGMTVLRMMKENPKLADIPLVFLTAKNSSANIMEGLNTGAADYICKPFNPDELVTRCARILKH